MTLPRLTSLRRAWEKTPPVAVSLQMVTQWMGFKPASPRKRAESAKEAIEQAASVGLPAMAELPADRELDLFDAPLGHTADGRSIHEVLRG